MLKGILLGIIGISYGFTTRFLFSRIQTPKPKYVRSDFYTTYLALEKLKKKAIRKRRAVYVQYSN